MSRRAPLRAIPIASLAVLLLAGLTPAASAGDVLLRVTGTIGDACLRMVHQNDIVTEVIHKRSVNGVMRLVGRGEVGATDDVCVAPLQSGDALNILKDGVKVRTLTVPVITASLQPVADTISGVMAPGSQGESLVVSDRIAAQAAELTIFVVDPAVDGSYLVDVTPDIADLGPGDSVQADLETAAGDRWKVRQATRAVSVRAGSSRFAGVAPRGSKVTLTLKRSGIVRATASVQVGSAVVDFAGDFRKAGRTVKVKPGDVVLMTGASVPRLTVMPPELSVTATDGGSLDATCFPDGRWLATIAPTYALSGLADGLGLVSVLDITGDVDLELGRQVKLWCEAPGGSGQLLTTVVE